MTGWKRWLRLTVLGGLVLGLYFVVPVGTRFEDDTVIRVAASLLILAALAAGVLWQVALQLDHPERRLDGLVLALVVAVLGFALGFYAVELHEPDQFDGIATRLDALYFTTSTLLTVGFGDAHAVGQLARGLVLVQMIFNVVVLATAATTLTSRVRERAAERVEARRAALEQAPTQQSGRIADHGRRTHRKPR
jgi:hypothetical protein